MLELAPTPLQTRSLREQVYDHLRHEMARGGLALGSFLDLDHLAGQLGISRTPLREALLQLTHEGFVTMLPRRGFMVEALSAEDIRHYYEIIGDLEAGVLRREGHRLTPIDLGQMRTQNEGMREAVAADDFDRYYSLNLAFHETYLRLSDNTRMKGQLASLKQRLYDWPRRRGFVKAWEEHSVRSEHSQFLDLLEAGDIEGAARHIQDVHWSFEVQKDFIQAYYFEALP